MPYKVVKGKSNWLIKEKKAGKWKTIAHSSSKKKAQASIRARYANE